MMELNDDESKSLLELMVKMSRNQMRDMYKQLKATLGVNPCPKCGKEMTSWHAKAVGNTPHRLFYNCKDCRLKVTITG